MVGGVWVVRTREAKVSERRFGYLVLYDIREPARWRRAYRVIRGFGVRVQYSVFHFRGGRRMMEQLRHALQEILTDEDRLMIVELCGACSARIAVLNRPGSVPADDDGWRIV